MEHYREHRSLERAAFRLFGMTSKAQLSPEDFFVHVHPEDRAEVRERLETSAAQKSVFEAEFRTLLDNDGVRWMHGYGRVTSETDGQATRMSGVMADITERKENETVLQQSEAKYRTLLETLEEGCCVFELIDDANGKAVDYRFLEVNQVLEEQTGLKGATGKRGSEGTPNTEGYWLEVYGEVAKTGKPQRVERYNQATGRWYSAYASRVGGEGSRQVCTVFSDITERKIREANLALLADIAEDFEHLASETEIMQAIGARLAGYLKLGGISFAEVDEERESVTVKYNWNASDVPQIVGTFRFADHMTEEFVDMMRARKTWVVNDTQHDERTDAGATAAISVGAIVNVPYFRQGEWQGCFTAMSRTPREWTDNENEQPLY